MGSGGAGVTGNVPVVDILHTGQDWLGRYPTDYFRGAALLACVFGSAAVLLPPGSGIQIANADQAGLGAFGCPGSALLCHHARNKFRRAILFTHGDRQPFVELQPGGGSSTRYPDSERTNTMAPMGGNWLVYHRCIHVFLSLGDA